MLRLNFFGVVTLTFLAVFSCKPKERFSDATTVADEYRVIISFISTGSGIDREALNEITKYIQNHSEKPVIEKYNWGREGEMDICLKLAELSTKQQESFVNGLKKMVTNQRVVQISENVPCVHKK